ncbi:ABC transporter protein [Halomicronema hongdechloris C2206]|uniref:ABC transporter protein n=1 Tax=Halomicronema hongdechloris C2206 TaxID=1641165 RepID=A0A1Z3HQS0_9CYAN|nr:ABC transporter ATP-binding protein [Halomicronema hongdechloris]ASC72660.1 ABC transporter protein [Halomicronema hongdechloris C2206]
MSQYIRKFLYILSDKKTALLALLTSILLTSFMEAVGIGLIGPFIALASNPDSINKNSFISQLYDISGLGSEESFIAALAIFILLVFYSKAYFSYKVRRFIFKFSIERSGELRSRLLNAYLKLPYTYHLKRNTAFLIQNIVTETNVFCNKTLLELLNSTVSVVMIISLVSLLMITDTLATLVISVVLLLTFGMIVKFRRNLSTWGKIISNSQAEMIRIINHSLGGLKETRVIGCEPYFEHQLQEQVARNVKASTSLMSFGILPRLVIESVIITFILGLASFSLIFRSNPEDLISTLGIFGVVAIRLMPVTTQLTSGLTKLRSTTYVVDKLYHDFKELEDLNIDEKCFLPRTSNVGASTSSLPKTFPFKSGVDVEAVSFKYEEATDLALRQVSFSLKKGESVALIGKSGAGKTTLVDLILGLLPPSGGDIKVDGRSVYKDLRAWQNLIGYIPQSIFLIDDTIERNIAFGVADESIDYERLWHAIEAAQLKELIEQLPNSLATRIGERGVCLSGGQRQRVGIARALYHEREILVLDEATSALDNETERLVTESIKSLSGQKTMIIIAHRLSTVEHCDRVYLMHQGEIVQSGSYQDVILAGSLA